jgi:hypothetical protein
VSPVAAPQAAPDAPAGRDWTPVIDELRARGAHRLDAVHFRFIETLARRAAAQQGAVRRVLDERLAHWLAACNQRLEGAPAPQARAHPRATGPFLDARGAAAQRGPLAELVARIDAAQPLAPAVRAPVTAADEGAGRAELRAMRDFRSTWARLRVDRQLSLSMARVPENAGPLHTERLVLRALQAMRDISPAYLAHFMAQVDTLLWLEQTRAGVSGVPITTARGARGVRDSPRKPGRDKPAA